MSKTHRLHNHYYANSTNYIRKQYVTVSKFPQFFIADPNYLYNGGFEDYEDPADYVRNVPKARRLG